MGVLHGKRGPEEGETENNKGGTFSLRYQKHQILKLCTRLDVEGRQVAYVHYFKFDRRSYNKKCEKKITITELQLINALQSKVNTS